MPSTREGQHLLMGEYVRSVSPTATLVANEASLYNRASTQPLLAAGSSDGYSDMIDVEMLPLNKDMNTGSLPAEGASDREVGKLVVDGFEQEYDNPV